MTCIYLTDGPDIYWLKGRLADSCQSYFVFGSVFSVPSLVGVIMDLTIAYENLQVLDIDISLPRHFSVTLDSCGV